VYLKMCGMMNQRDVAACVELGVDAVGIVVDYPVPVPWNLTRDEGRALVARVPAGTTSVVVCSGTPKFLAELAREVRPDALQVHGDESLAQTEEVVRLVEPLGIKVYRALRISPDTGRASGEIADVAEAARAIEQTGVSGLVVDAKVAHRPGGTGVQVGVASLRKVVAAVSLPVIAAGGLNAANVREVIRSVRPFGVDVLSGIEDAPGKKSRVKMAEFAGAARAGARADGLPSREPLKEGEKTRA